MTVRISAFPFLEKFRYIKLHGPQPPDILFIDLDARNSSQDMRYILALVKTLRISKTDSILMDNQLSWKVVLEDII